MPHRDPCWSDRGWPSRPALILVLVVIALATGVAQEAAGQTPAAGAGSRHANRPSGVSASRRAFPVAVPSRFVGMNVDGPLLGDPANLSREFGRMVLSGVESVRVVFDWAQAEPQQNGPIDFSQTDSLVADAAARGLTVLPVIIYAPAWDSAPHPPGTYAPPASDAPYAAYAAALVRRYGPAGSFWPEHPRLTRVPIRMWQIWNEPNFQYYWGAPHFVPGYVSLLHAAHAAIKQADPGAEVVLAGFPDAAWTYLNAIYRVKGARSDFEVVAAHPYTAKPQNVIKFLALVRRVMKRYGDAGKPLLVTETGWSSSIPHQPSDNYCCQTTETGQVRNLEALLPLLARARTALNLAGFYYYTWVGQEYRGAPSFNFAGLFDYAQGRLIAKPSYAAFRRSALSLERCREKGSSALTCVRRG
jgi:hypothetical protein